MCPIHLRLWCDEHAIEHRLTKVNHLSRFSYPIFFEEQIIRLHWSNGRAVRMNPTIKDATVKCYYDDSHE